MKRLIKFSFDFEIKQRPPGNRIFFMTVFYNLLFVLATFLVLPSEAAAAWYNDSWDSRQAVYITDRANVTDYPLAYLKIYYNDSTKTADDEVNLGGLSQTDFSDVVITDSD